MNVAQTAIPQLVWLWLYSGAGTFFRGDTVGQDSVERWLAGTDAVIRWQPKLPKYLT